MTPIAALLSGRPIAVFSVAGWFARLSPSGAVLLATLGVCLMAWELNRPGRVVPGATGLLLFLLAASRLLFQPLRVAALVTLVVGCAVLLTNVWLRLAGLTLVFATIAVVAGLLFLVPRASPVAVHPAVAVGCGLLVGVGGSALSRIALRARRAKKVN